MANSPPVPKLGSSVPLPVKRQAAMLPPPTTTTRPFESIASRPPKVTFAFFGDARTVNPFVPKVVSFYGEFQSWNELVDPSPIFGPCDLRPHERRLSLA